MTMKNLSLFLVKAVALVVQLTTISAHLYCESLQGKARQSLPNQLTNDVPEMAPEQLQNEWPCYYDRYLAIDEVAINELWIESVLTYLDESVAVGKVDCSDDVTNICQLVQTNHVVLIKKDHKEESLPLKSHPLNENDFMRAVLELQADGLHVSCETTDQVEIIAKNSGALVTLVTDTEHQEYLKYLGGLPVIGKELQRPLVTVYSSDVIPSKKRPTNPHILLHIWFVVNIGDELQWLPMKRNSDDIIIVILKFVAPLKYPVVYEYHATDTPSLFRDGDINILYVLMTPDHRKSSPMETVVSLAKKYIGQFCFVIADFDRYGPEISQIQLPSHLEESPYFILKHKNDDELVHADIYYDLLDDWLTHVINPSEPEPDPPIKDVLFMYNSMQDFEEAILTANYYILAGFCRSTSCDKISELLSPIASVASELHPNLDVVIVKCQTLDYQPDGLLITYLPALAFYDHANKSWTKYCTKMTWESIIDFLSKQIPIRNISKPIPVIPRLPAQAEEDDQMGLLANRLGAADITNTSQLTDTTIGSFISQHKTAIVTFYQKWCVQSKVFLHHVVPLQQQLSANLGVAIVSCSDWPDVCANHNITTYPTVLIFKGSEAIWYRGHMSAKSIIASLPYYTVPIVQQLNTEGESVEDFITNCTRGGLAGVVGIFPDEVSPNYHQFLSTAAHYHGRRLFGVLITNEVPEDLPVEVTKLPVVFMVDGRDPQLVVDPDQLETTLLSANELTPETLPYYFSVKKPLLVLVVNEETNFHPLVELAASHYPLVTWMNYDRYGRIIERYLSKCSQPPVLLVFDFSAGVVYHGNKCGEHLSSGEVESFISKFKNGLLSAPIEFKSREWKPAAEPFTFPSHDDEPPPANEDPIDDFDD